MPHRRARGEGEGEPEAAPLPGVLSFRPRLPAILLLLTVAVAVAGYRITRDEGEKAAERVARAALSAWREAAAAPAPSPGAGGDPAPLLARALGLPVPLPPGGGEGGIEYLDVRKRSVGGARAALLRFTLSGARYLLLVARQRGGGSDPSDEFFSGPSFRSGSQGGLSFVFWNRAGLSWCLVTDRDVGECIDTARDRFSGSPSP